MKIKHFKFYTEYNQFYLSSDNADFLNNIIDFDSSSYKSRLKIEKNSLVIFTQSYGNIKGEIEILETSNTNIDYNKYDHIVEGGINIQSGKLKILDCPHIHKKLLLIVKPGKYRVRIYSSNLLTVKESDLVNETDNDYYRIELWPSEDMKRKVLKQYEER
ncbi:hypothetical protein [Chryseobacterium sp. c4a]|uniref:hypothetical protein n=1 Tax=Chryseobacterium sp. c4a TaxID=1573582 RepID=UPI001357A577|nr:hypothetical protein [Chryseobacterium sp. c4a]